MIYLKTKPKNLNEIIKRVCSGERTYSDKDCIKIQCYKDKLRSFDDLLETSQTYYPLITPKSLLHTLLTTDYKRYKGYFSDYSNISIRRYPSFHTCSNINRITIYFIENKPSYTTDGKHNSKYSWKELFDMLNIKNQKDLNDFIAKYKKY